ncbi:MAG TPA: hypothetical protein VI078_02935 [bacterium]
MNPATAGGVGRTAEPACASAALSLGRALLEHAGVLALATPFFWLAAHNYLQLDFWFDEIATLENYVMVPLAKTVTDYTYPNNHVFFSLLMNLAFKAFHIHNFNHLLDHPRIARLIMLAISAATLLLVYAVGRRSFGRFTGACALVLLATCVPFYNYAVQFRGYVLSMALLCLLLPIVWDMERDATAGRAAAAAGVSALLVYTIPLNLYVLAAMAACQAAFAAADALAPRLGRGGPGRDWRPSLAVAASLAAGVAASALLYAPVLRRVLHNPYVESGKDFRPFILSGMMPQVLGDLLSRRWALLAALPVAIVVLARRGGGPAKADARRRLVFLGATLVLPFVFSFLRRDSPYDRVFVNLAPLAALLLAAGLGVALGNVLRNRRALSLCAVLGVAAYCSLVFVGEVRDKDACLARLVNGPRVAREEHDLYHNFFQFEYQPNEIARLAREFLDRHGEPVTVVIERETDRQAFPRQYLRKYGIDALETRDRPWREDAVLEETLRITTHPAAFLRTARWRLPGVRCERLEEDVTFADIFYCRRTAGAGPVIARRAPRAGTPALAASASAAVQSAGNAQ